MKLNLYFLPLLLSLQLTAALPSPLSDPILTNEATTSNSPCGHLTTLTQAEPVSPGIWHFNLIYKLSRFAPDPVDELTASCLVYHAIRIPRGWQAVLSRQVLELDGYVEIGDDGERVRFVAGYEFVKSGERSTATVGFGGEGNRRFQYAAEVDGIERAAAGTCVEGDVLKSSYRITGGGVKGKLDGAEEDAEAGRKGWVITTKIALMRCAGVDGGDDEVV